MSTAPTLLDDLRTRLAPLTLRDERRLSSRLDAAVRRPPGDERDAALAALAEEVARAEAVVAARRAAVPTIRYPDELPLTARRDDLLAAIEANQVVIVAGETGSGKSTQLPKLCLELGRGVRGLVGHTQPRRVAARSVAERVAEELGTTLGDAVGYTVRFTDRVGDRTLVKVMTDGILLAETQRDRELRRYDTIIVDEAHERSLNIDFLLGYLHQLLPRRPDLKLVITSATIDTDRFARHFGGAPVVEVSGRTYPVEVRYRPLGDEDGDDERDQVTAICEAVDELAAEGPGDVLVFVSGEREIHDAADALRRLDRPGTEILPLYARLSAAEQHRVFEPHRGRRIVLATNVAETSLTVPGVRYVVDAGTARISRYSRRLKVQRLPIEPVSQASANQRAGRCGRVAPGVCIRLYSEEDYAARPAFTEPEILRTNLASVILQMAALGLGDVASFPFVEPPDARSINDGIALLEELGALRPDGDGGLERRLTPLGRRLAQLPVDPRLGRMVLEADQLGCVREVMVVAAALSIQDPRERPQAHQQAADEAHRRFATEGSDFLAYVRLWDHLRERQRELSGNQFRKLCRAEFLNYLRVREWQDLYSQLRQVAATLGVRIGTDAAHPDHVHRALLAGLLSHLGMREGTERDFRGARSARFAIANGSVLARKPPRWVMAGELVETNRLWARVCAPIQPEWAERTGAHLVKRTYGEPVWDPRRAAAVVPERVTLYGLPVVHGRQADVARLDPALARTMFLRHALVAGEWPAAGKVAATLERNRALVAELEALEERARGRRQLVADDALYAFYDRVVGAEVTSGRRFESWWKQARAEKPDLLVLTRAEALRPGAGAAGLTDFPDRWEQGDLSLAVTYRFEPGAPFDGVTVHVPVAVLDQVRADGFDWQVPGMREELAETLARSLPKPVRRHLVPVAEAARRVLATLDPGAGRLIDGLAAGLGREAGLPITAGDLRVEDLPDHLRITFSVDDERGAPLAHGKDLTALQAKLRTRARAAIARATPTAERTGLRTWAEVGELPREVASTAGGHTVRAYPALVDEGPTVGVRVLTSPAAQARAMRAGTRRLLQLTVAVPRKAMERSVTNEVKLAVARLGRGSVAELLDECAAATIDALVAEHGGPAWDTAGFEALTEAVREGLADRAPAVTADGARAVVAAAAVQARLSELTAPAMQPAVADARSQLGRLVGPGALLAAGVDRLGDVRRYLRALDRRLERLPADPGRDRKAMALVHDLEDAYAAALGAVAPDQRGPRHDEVLWTLEELRVSLFAQQVGTARPVSEQRVRKEIAALRQP